LSDSLLLPLNCSDYAEMLEGYLDTAVELYQTSLTAWNVSMGESGLPINIPLPINVLKIKVARGPLP